MVVLKKVKVRVKVKVKKISKQKEEIMESTSENFARIVVDKYLREGKYTISRDDLVGQGIKLTSVIRWKLPFLFEWTKKKNGDLKFIWSPKSDNILAYAGSYSFFRNELCEDIVKWLCYDHGVNLARILRVWTSHYKNSKVVDKNGVNKEHVTSKTRSEFIIDSLLLAIQDAYRYHKKHPTHAVSVRGFFRDLILKEEAEYRKCNVDYIVRGELLPGEQAPFYKTRRRKSSTSPRKKVVKRIFVREDEIGVAT